MTRSATQSATATDAPTVEWDLLVAVMGAPYHSDNISTMLRWVAAVAASGARVQVWTCGYATLLTQRGLTSLKPGNPLHHGQDYPTSAAHVDLLVAQHPTNLRWLSCRFCSEERGAVDHIEAVRLRPATSFARHVAESAKTVFVGVI